MFEHTLRIPTAVVLPPPTHRQTPDYVSGMLTPHASPILACQAVLLSLYGVTSAAACWWFCNSHYALQGVYLAACLKMFGLLEDSGWALNKEGEDDTNMPQDENPLPDVPTLGSYSGII